MKFTTLVLGASTNPDRYSYLAIHSLVSRNHQVIAVGNSDGEVKGVQIKRTVPKIEDLDTLTLFINPTNQKSYYDRIIQQKPKIIIFNPGAENEELEILAMENGIEFINACTILMLTTGNY